MNKFGYTIRDVDKAFKNYILGKELSVRMEGLDVRIKVYSATPDAMLGRKYIPGICIESGYTISVPAYFQKEIERFEVNESNSDLVDVTTERIIDVRYSYKIGFYVYYKSHCAYLEEQFLRMFPNKKFLDVVDKDVTSYRLCFGNDTGLTPMDEEVDNRKVYRRDTVLTTSLLFKETEVQSLIRPFAKVQVDELSSSDWQ